MKGILTLSVACLFSRLSRMWLATSRGNRLDVHRYAVTDRGPRGGWVFLAENDQPPPDGGPLRRMSRPLARSRATCTPAAAQESSAWPAGPPPRERVLALLNNGTRTAVPPPQLTLPAAFLCIPRSAQSSFVTAPPPPPPPSFHRGLPAPGSLPSAVSQCAGG